MSKGVSQSGVYMQLVPMRSSIFLQDCNIKDDVYDYVVSIDGRVSGIGVRNKPLVLHRVFFISFCLSRFFLPQSSVAHCARPQATEIEIEFLQARMEFVSHFGEQHVSAMVVNIFSVE